jgi:hypothetical protein
MPVYHFNMHDGQSYPDALGSECQDIEAARIEAVRRIGDLLREHAARFWTGDEWTMQVADEAGLTLFCLTFVAQDAPAIPPHQAGKR